MNDCLKVVLLRKPLLTHWTDIGNSRARVEAELEWKSPKIEDKIVYSVSCTTITLLLISHSSGHYILLSNT